MSVKSTEIDDQHKQLVAILNELYQAFMDKEHSEKIGSIISKLTDYTKYHFGTEEKYFAMFNYGEKDSHILEHQEFRLKVEEFIKKYQGNKGALTYEVMIFLKNWLTHHILETDKRYMDCFISHGVK